MRATNQQMLQAAVRTAGSEMLQATEALSAAKAAERQALQATEALSAAKATKQQAPRATISSMP